MGAFHPLQLTTPPSVPLAILIHGVQLAHQCPPHPRSTSSKAVPHPTHAWCHHHSHDQCAMRSSPLITLELASTHCWSVVARICAPFPPRICAPFPPHILSAETQATNVQPSFNLPRVESDCIQPVIPTIATPRRCRSQRPAPI